MTLADDTRHAYDNAEQAAERGDHATATHWFAEAQALADKLNAEG